MKCVINLFAIVFCLAMTAASAYAAPQESSMKGINKFFEKMDTNHDGVLTREEAKKTPVLSVQFNDMDVNQDGKLMRHEMIASMEMKRRRHGRSAKNLQVTEGRNVILKQQGRFLPALLFFRGALM